MAIGIIRENRIFILGLLIYYFAACVSNDIYIPSMPHLRDAFETSLNNVQNSMTAWYIGVCLPQLILGPWADTVGHRRIMIGGCFIFILASLGCMIASTIGHFTLCRFLQGLCVASLNITSYSTIRRYFRYEDSVKLLSWMAVVASSAPILGPILGGYFLVLLSWRIDFLFLIIICMPAILMLYSKLPETNHLIKTEPTTLWQMYKSVLSNPTFVRNSFCYGALMGVMISYLTSAPYVLIDSMQIAPNHFGFIQAPIFIMSMTGGTLVGILMKYFKTNNIKYVGISLLSIALFGMLLVNYFIHIDEVIPFILPVAIYAFAYALCGSILTADAMDSLETHIGAGAAIHSLVMAGMGALGSWLVGIFYSNHVLSVAKILVSFNIAALCFYFLIPTLYSKLSNYLN